MRKITTLLMLCLVCIGLNAQTTTTKMEVPVKDLSQLSNSAKYFIRSERCFLLYSETVNNQIASSNATALSSPAKNLEDNNQLFEIRNEGGKYYLYSVGAGKYVTSNGSFSDTPAGDLTFTQTSNATYMWKLCIGGNGMNSQDPGQMNAGIVVNGWTTEDPGNRYQIMAVEEALAHTGWTVTAFNEAPTSGNEGGVSHIQDVDGETFYHSNWSTGYIDGTASKNQGQDGVQGFMIELPASCSISKMTYAGRSNTGNNWATKVRVYVYETLPDGITTNLSGYTFTDKEAKFGTGNTVLGTPAFENSSSPWAENRAPKTIEFATPVTGKYVLFLADATTYSNGYFTCSYLNILGEYNEVIPEPIVTEGKYYTLECRSSEAHSTTRFIADNGTVIDGRSAEGSAFTFEAAGDGGYYMKSYKSGKYLNCETGTKNIYASSEKVTSWVLNEPFSGKVSLSAGGDLYLNNNGSKCADGSTTNLQANYHAGGPAEGNACSLWALAEVEVFIPAVANGVYEIQNQDDNGNRSRGYLVHSTAYEGKIKLAESKYPGLTSTQYAFASRTESGVNPYWYVYNSEKGNTYIFSLANGQFINDTNEGAVVLSATPQAVNIVENGSYLNIESTIRSGYFVAAAVGWGQADNNVRWNNESNDGGYPYTFNVASEEVNAEMLSTAIAAIEALENPAPTVTEEEMNALLNLANTALAATGVGYPTADCAERAPLTEAVANANTDKTSKAYYDALAAALTAFANTSTINLPEDGKAYTFTNVQKNGTKYYLNYDAVNGVTVSTEAAEATTYVCKDLGEGKFMFVNNDGKYLIAKGENAGGNGNTGYMDQYDATYTALTIAKLAGSYVEPASPAEIFGYVSVMGKRNDGLTNLCVVIASNGNWSQASAPFWNDAHSSAFQLVEATYPNKPLMKAANGITNGEEAIAAVATYCAPFATVLPAGVNAYYATSDEGHYVKLTLLDGAIPANTGVLLTATDDAFVDQAVVMVPAAAEVQGTADGNLFAADAAKGEYTVGAEVNAYVVGKSGETVGFYPLSASNRTMAQGKAYLVLDQALSAVKFYFGGDDVTGIEAVEKAESNNAPIFDLSGRRVVKAAKGGIYIQNGKKFIVK